MNIKKGMAKMAKKTISLRIDEEMETKLREKAKQNGKDLSSFCRDILLQSMDKIEQLKNEIEMIKKELEETKAIQIIKRGGRPRKLKDDEETKAKILEMYKSSKSLLSIAKEMDMAYSTIYRICKQYN